MKATGGRWSTHFALENTGEKTYNREVSG